MNQGIWITFEGGEGSGKSTLSKWLYEKLKSHNIPVILTREPGGSENAESIRKLLVEGDADRWLPSTECLLMFAARDDHFKRLIHPSLAKGIWVICDRFFDSTIAYQGYGKHVSVDFLNQLYTFTVGNHKPNRTYLCDVPVKEGIARSNKRLQSIDSHENRFEKLSFEFHERVREGFLSLANEDTNRFLCLNSLNPLKQLQSQIWEDICSTLLTPTGPS